jgi:hypothetical protein
MARYGTGHCDAGAKFTSAACLEATDATDWLAGQPKQASRPCQDNDHETDDDDGVTVLALRLHGVSTPTPFSGFPYARCIYTPRTLSETCLLVGRAIRRLAGRSVTLQAGNADGGVRGLTAVVLLVRVDCLLGFLAFELACGTRRISTAASFDDGGSATLRTRHLPSWHASFHARGAS